MLEPETMPFFESSSCLLSGAVILFGQHNRQAERPSSTRPKVKAHRKHAYSQEQTPQ